MEEGILIDPSSRIIEDVNLRSGASAWPLAILRADSEPIVIGTNPAILDMAFVEAPLGHRVIIENDVIVSHEAILHGCIVRRRALIGIGAIVLDGAEVRRNSIIASGSVIPPGARIPKETLVMGILAKVVRAVSEKEMAAKGEPLAEIMDKSVEYRRILR